MKKRKNKKPGGQPGPHVWLDLEAFVKVWQKSKSRAEVAKHFKCSLLRASNRAAYLRKKGVPLLRLNHHLGNPRPKNYYTALARAAREAGK